MIKKLATTLAAGALALASVAVSVSPAQAAMVAPTSVPHGTVYDCKGPYWQYSLGYYYDCYVDYDWYAEWFLGKQDMRMKLRAWYTA